MRKTLAILCIVVALCAAWIPSVAALPSVPSPIFASANPLIPNASPYFATSNSQAFTKKVKNNWPWYTTRASGLVAATLLSILLMSGIGLFTGLSFKMLEPLAAWAAHRAVGLAFGITVLIHVFSLLLDKFVGFNLLDLLVPFYSHYKPSQYGSFRLGSFNMAIGIVAFYLMIVIIITSLLLINRKQKLWRLVHYASYAVVGMVFVHGLFMGTDLHNGGFRLLWVIGGVALLLPIFQRLRRAYSIGGRE